MHEVIQHSRPWITAADVSAVEATLSNRMIAQGDKVRALEEQIAAQTGVNAGIACASGTAALTLALKALELSPGDEVMLPTYVCWNVLAAVRAAGAEPRFCDVDSTGVMTLATAAAALTPGTRALIAVHIFGHPCDVTSLATLGLPIVEDTCQAFGLVLAGVPAGSAGTYGVLSFHATKCLATGEGGMVLARDKERIHEARRLTTHWQTGNAVATAVMTDMQAALGLSQLSRYPSFLERRRQLLSNYRDAISQLDRAVPGFPSGDCFLFRCTIRTTMNFDAIQQRFLAAGVHVRRGVDDLLHRRCGLPDRNFPVATQLFDTTVSIPFYPSLTDDEADRVIQAMRKVFGGN